MTWRASISETRLAHPRAGEAPTERVCWAASPVRLLLVLALPLMLIARAWSFDYIVDDAYVSFRYARNLATFGELVFNAGERVEGITNLLWTLILAVAESLSLPVERFAQGLGVLSACLLLVGVVGAALRHGLPFAEAWFIGLFLATLPPLPLWAQSGMETAAFALLFFLGVVTGARAERAADGVGVGLLAGLGFALRPEGALVLPLVSASAWLGKRRVASWLPAAAAAFLVVASAVTTFRLSYYGAFLPNTVRAKQNAVALLVGDGSSYTSHFAIHYLGVVVVVLAGLGVWKRRVRPVVAAALSHSYLQCAAGLIAFVTFVGGDWMPYHRFFVPVMPLLLIGLVEAARIAYADVSRAAVAGLAAITLIATLGFEQLGFDAERLAYNRDHLRPLLELVAEGLNRLETRPTIAISAAGLVPYRTNLKTTDLLGLTDAAIASNAPSSLRSLPGHHKMVREDQLESLRPDLVFVNIGASLSAQPLKHLPPWGLEAELFKYRAFARNYRLVAFPAREGVVNAYGRRDAPEFLPDL